MAHLAYMRPEQCQELPVLGRRIIICHQCIPRQRALSFAPPCSCPCAFQGEIGVGELARVGTFELIVFLQNCFPPLWLCAGLRAAGGFRCGGLGKSLGDDDISDRAHGHLVRKRGAMVSMLSVGPSFYTSCLLGNYLFHHPNIRIRTRGR